MDMPDYGWPSVLVALITAIGAIVTAVRAARKDKRERKQNVEQERKESAAAGDLDIEHIDFERRKRM